METEKIEMSGADFKRTSDISTPEECVSGDYTLDLEGKEPKRVLSGFTAMMIVVASMVGTGIFTTTGILLENTPSALSVLISWLIGGLLAFFGALSYSELVAMYPRNGGEYQILSRVFHPSVGFVAGWISLIVGFSAPIASAAMAFSKYFNHFILHSGLAGGIRNPLLAPTGLPLETSEPPLNEFWVAFVVLILFSLIHAANVKQGGVIQVILTVIKIVIVIGFIGGGLYLGDFSNISLTSQGETSFLSPAFAIGLIYVTYAYTGWNGSAYIAGEIKNPTKAMPRALALGTGLVTLIYLGLNVIFLISAPTEELIGKVEIGAVAAISLFGTGMGSVFSLVISFLLLSSLSAMVMTGPRIYQSMGEDYPILKLLTVRKGGSGPYLAITLQAIIATAMLISAEFDELIMYMGFTLSITSALTVIGVFVMRKKSPNAMRPYKCWGYPITPILFILLSLWMIIFSFIQTPIVAFVGLGTVLSGFLIYYLIKPKKRES